MKLAHQCKDHGVKEIVLSSVVATGRVNADVLIHINESLKNLCMANGFGFVNNDNISEGNLYKDRLHLLEAGKRILAKKFINSINGYYLLLKHTQNNHSFLFVSCSYKWELRDSVSLLFRILQADWSSSESEKKIFVNHWNNS